MKKIMLAIALTCLFAGFALVIGCMGDSDDGGPACDPACSEGQECVYVEGTTDTVCKQKATAACEPACTADQTCTDGVCVADVPAVCGNQICDDGETEAGCPADCTGGDTPPVCGNGACETGETAENCATDCAAAPKCGDGTCDAGEQATCPNDCPAGPVCGNGQCEAGEDQANCPSDCGAGGPVCGNEICEEGESQINCPSDCGGGGPECGNGQCEAGESAANCPADCGGGGGLTCAQIVDCLGENQCEDEQCFQNCIEQGSTTAQGQFMAVLTCFQNSGCPETDQACLQQACAAQLEACGGGGGPAECGNGTCEQGETPDSCPADCGGGGACGDIDYVGLCEGNIVKWCEGGAIQQIDCSQGGPQCVCGFKEDAGFYDCTGQCG